MTLAPFIAVLMLACQVSWTDPPEPQVRRVVDKGLEFLANSQSPNGRWEANQGAYPVAMTSLAGMNFLLDGNTTLQGRYANAVQRAAAFLLSQTQPNGLIGNPRVEGPYMFGHGFAMLFLSQVLGEEEDITRRGHIVEVLTRAVEFCGSAQTEAGGWGYLTAKDDNNFDEGSVTVTQIQGLRGCRNAGIAVPKQIIDKGVDYIKRCTNNDGGVRYRLPVVGPSQPPITAAAVACLFNAGEFENPLCTRLIAFADKSLLPSIDNRNGSAHWHYAHYYYSQVVYRLGDERWKTYRKRMFPVLLSQQAADGSWREGFVGPVFSTSTILVILQVDNNYLPIYQR